jgi:hypothetical protein
MNDRTDAKGRRRCRPRSEPCDVRLSRRKPVCRDSGAERQPAYPTMAQLVGAMTDADAPCGSPDRSPRLAGPPAVPRSRGWRARTALTPASVNFVPPTERSSSCTLGCRSRSQIRRLNVGSGVPRGVAAAERLPAWTTATNMWVAFRSMQSLPYLVGQLSVLPVNFHI